MKKIIKFFGSLPFALWLIGTLAVVLIASTLLESAQGTPVAQRFFYRAGWFDFFLALFGLNILCSSLSRWPYKKYHTGFLIVHAGILILLIGSLLSRYGGVDGQLSLAEGELGNRISLAGYELVINLPDQGIKILSLDRPVRLIQTKLAEPEPGAKIIVKKIIADAAISRNTEEGGSEAPANLGIEFTLHSEMAGANQPVALFQHHPSDPSPNLLALGAATFELTDTAPAEVTPANGTATTPRLRLTLKETGETFAWDLDPLPAQDLPLGKSGLIIKNIRYFPDARVGAENKLVNISSEPANPAVEFDAVDRSGHATPYTYFELFPNFESMHKKTGQKDAPQLAVSLEIPKIKTPDSPHKAGLRFFQKNGRWAYLSHSSKNPDREDFLELNKEYPAGWMDFTFKVQKLYSHALISTKATKAAQNFKGDKADMAVEIAAEKDGREVSTDWVLPGENVTLETSKGPMLLTLRRRSAPIPFTLKLKEFRKVDYPGTSEASSYESDVALEDHFEGIKIEKTIRMNKPLDYKGYRIFQSSFNQEPDGPSVSVFTVAKNPGIKLIYSGAVILCLGIITVFYIKPLSSFGRREK